MAAAAEGRRFCGIEKNADVHLFKKDAIDYVALAEKRILAARNSLGSMAMMPVTGFKSYRIDE